MSNILDVYEELSKIKPKDYLDFCSDYKKITIVVSKQEMEIDIGNLPPNLQIGHDKS
jgi:hypothetical protein